MKSKIIKRIRKTRNKKKHKTCLSNKNEEILKRTCMALGEFMAVKTRVSDWVSVIRRGWKIRTEATLGAFFKRENLKAFLSRGLCKKRSELGYFLRMLSIIEGPVSSNLLAPPTKHTAILDRTIKSLPFDGKWIPSVVELEMGLELDWKSWEIRKWRKEVKEVKGKEEKRRRKRRRGERRKSQRQSRWCETHFAKGMAFFLRLSTIISLYYFTFPLNLCLLILKIASPSMAHKKRDCFGRLLKILNIILIKIKIIQK